MPTQTFPGKYENLEKIADFVRQHAQQTGFGDTSLYAIETAVDEACSNIIEHGYGGEGKGDIECCCESDETSLTITLTDQGKPFDPSKVDMPDLNVPLDQRKAHGLGLYFMHQMMDEISFKYKEGEGNILTMIKYHEVDVCEPDTPQPGSDPEWQHLLRLGETLLKTNAASNQAKHIEEYVTKMLSAKTRVWLAEPYYPLPGQPDTETIPEDAAPFLVQQAMMTGQACYRNEGDQDGTNCARMVKPFATAVPFIAQEKLLAVLEVERYEGPPLCLEEMNELHRLTTHISTILQISRQETIKHWHDEQLALVRSVSTQIANEHDLDELCRRVTNLIRDTFNYYHVAVFTLNDKENLLEFRAESNPGEADCQRTEKTLHLNQGIVGHVANKGVELIASDVQDEPLYRPVDGLPDTRSEAALPLSVDGHVLGVLDIQSDHLDTFHETDMIVLRALANTIALAVEDARLYSDLKWQAEQTKMVFEVSHKLTSILDLDKLLEAVVTMIRSHFGYPFVHIFTVHNTRRRIVYEVGSGARSQAMHERELEYDLDNPKGIIPWVARNGKIKLVNDASKDPLFVPTAFPPTNTQAELCIPLIFADSVLGVLDIQSTHIDAFDEKQIPLLEAMAANISTAIRNANLYRSERWRRQVGDSFRDVAGLLSSNADLDTLLDSILSELGRNLPCDASAIWLLDSRLDPEGNPCMNLAAVQGVEPTQLKEYCPQDDVRAWLDNMLASREPVIRQEGEPHDPLGATLEMPANYSSITAPLYIADQPLGAITLVHRSSGRYGNESQAMTSTFASYAAMAIRNAKLFGDAQNQAWISTVLLQIAEASQAVESLEDLLATTVRITPLLVGVEMCAIFLWEENRQSFILKDQYNLELPHTVSRVFDRNRAPALGQLAATRAITFLENLHNDLGVPEEMNSPDDQTMILLPLQVRDTLLGALLVVHQNQGQADAILSYSQQTLSILQGITRQTSLALENQLLLEARQEEGYITAVLLQVSQAVANQNDLSDILDTIVHLMPILVGIESCAIYRREDSGNFAPLQAHTGSRSQDTELMQTFFAPGTFKTLDEVLQRKTDRLLPLGRRRGFFCLGWERMSAGPAIALSRPAARQQLPAGVPHHYER